MDVRKQTAYMALHDQERFIDSPHSDEPKIVRTSSPLKSWRRLFLLLIVGILAIIVSFTIYRFYAGRRHIDQCGTTATEARAKGCHFEMTGFSWLPKECLDLTVEAEFLELDLHYYRDLNYTQEAPLEEVRRGDGHGYFVKQDYHRAHCAFLFKKLHKAISSGNKVDGLISSVHHTSHCVHMLLASPNFRSDVAQVAFTKWPYCGKNGGYNVEWAKQGEWTD
ncbi:hypothetical protein BGW36DRAFT_433728 [Talaromyces proteolyticus]|uniref:Uncharacterized protein n=1 Tax=Talaromyces proteolyticus TaxID=1131652 RepID=A0AAD4PU57_9EURO|nr:uncharacterized protein BGW36DRAFT_433728 [Talaromyces proteolyticus]KAH8688955.1 hypothetical protein BGW36DRAFT_433728 [Talaromyces proteolyticus]